MANVLEPDVEHPGPPTDADEGDDDDGEAVGPWWGSPWRLVVLGLAVMFLGAAIGYAITTSKSSGPGNGSVDAGFLQDMRWHHDQAVRMSLTMLDKPETAQDAGVRSLAADILLSQQFEGGVMAGQLRTWGLPEANESGTGMAWMGMPVPIDRMPGMASDDDLTSLQQLTGKDADALFLELMIAHHSGGLHMASDASTRASTKAVRDLAASMLKAQEYEIGELHAAQQRLGLPVT